MLFTLQRAIVLHLSRKGMLFTLQRAIVLHLSGGGMVDHASGFLKRTRMHYHATLRAASIFWVR